MLKVVILGGTIFPQIKFVTNAFAIRTTCDIKAIRVECSEVDDVVVIRFFSLCIDLAMSHLKMMNSQTRNYQKGLKFT